jgi:general secretion pathway protein D
MQILKKIIIVATLTGVILLIPGHVLAEETSDSTPETKPVEVVKTDDDIKVKLNFQDAPLQTVLEYLSETAGLTVVSDEPLINGRMTVISRRPISLKEAVSLINSILKEKSLTTVLTGKVLKVVTLQNAKKENIPVITGRNPENIIPSDDVVTYVIPVSHVTATALKTNLQSLVAEYAGLEANEDGNALIITDTTANIKRLMEIIKALDTYMATVAEIRVFRLLNTDATSVANLINSMFQQQQQGGTRGQQGARNPMEMMMQMRGGGPGGRGGRSNSDNQNSSSGGGSVNVQVVAAADTRTNSVVVRGPAEALEVVADMIKALDDRTVKVADVRVFQLRYADAMNTAQIINELFGGSSSSSSQQDQGPMFFMRGGGPGGRNAQQQEESTNTLKVTAAADSRTNTVVVTGPDNILDVVAEVVKNLDSQIPTIADVKVFHLEYADAQDTAELINEVFGESRSSSQTTRSTGQQNQQIRFQRGGFGGFGGQQQSTQSTGGISDVTIIASADSRTNSVVVSGPPETLEIIANIIKELDENPEQERQIFLFPLKNASSENLMEILNNLFAEMQALNQQNVGTTGQQFQGGQRAAQPAQASQASDSSSSSNDLSEETYFEADLDTNTLLVLTSSKNYEKIKPILEELDKPVGQVLIKVLFAEVTHSDSIDLGTEFSMLNLRSSGDSVDTSMLFGKPASLFTEAGTSKPTGLSVRTIEGDLDITLRALQETGKLNVLSRPYILTRNNQLATITVGEEVPIPTGTTTVAGQTQTTIEYRDDIGIVLDVTPSINLDGLVNMTVSPKITTRSTETVAISEDLNAVAFAKRSAETRVAVHDGQTIVIGGLIEDQLKDTIKKIPLLGDIPILDLLFKRTIKEKSKTELLIFLTPYVAKDARGLTPISEAERARSTLNTDETAAEIFKKHMDAMDNKVVDVNVP